MTGAVAATASLAVSVFGWDLSWELLTLNAAYVVYVASPVFKEILKLRVVLLIATGFFIAYGIISGIHSVTLWNIPFGLLHLWGIAGLIRERMGVSLSEEAEALRVLLMPGLDRPEFSKLWNSGNQITITNTKFITEGQPVENVALILDGLVHVTSEAGLDRDLGRFAFVGEQSALMDRPASASVTTVGEARLWSWNQQALKKLVEENEPIRQAWNGALARDLAKKVAPVPSDARRTIPHTLLPPSAGA